MRPTSEKLYAPGPISKLLINHVHAGDMRNFLLRMRKASEHKSIDLAKTTDLRLQAHGSMVEISQTATGSAPTDYNSPTGLQALTYVELLPTEQRIGIAEQFILHRNWVEVKYETYLQVVLPVALPASTRDSLIGKTLGDVADCHGTILEQIADRTIISIRGGKPLEIRLDCSDWNEELRSASQDHEVARAAILRRQQARDLAKLQRQQQELANRRNKHAQQRLLRAGKKAWA